MSDTAGSPPVRLRQAREAAGLHIAALAAALKVPVRKLELLEAGRYDDLPDLTFARALASSVCRHLKVDPAPVLEEIPQPEEPHLSQFPKAISAPFRTPPHETGGGSSGSGSRWVMGLGGLLVLAAAAVVLLPDPSSWSGWFQRSGGEATVTQTPGSTPSVVVESVTSAPVSPNAAAPAQPDLLPSAPAPDASVSSPPSVSISGAPQVAEAPTPEAKTAGQLLVLKARGDSWVEVVNGSGAVVVKRMMLAGDVLDFSSAPPYSVVVGRADQVDVMVRGQLLDTAPMTRNSVARFEVK